MQPGATITVATCYFVIATCITIVCRFTTQNTIPKIGGMLLNYYIGMCGNNGDSSCVLSRRELLLS